MSRAAVLAAVVFVCACDAVTLPGHDEADIYAFETATDPPIIYRWPLGAEIRVLIMGGASDRAVLLADAFADGATAWNRATLWGEYRLAFAEDLTDADVVLRWSDVPLPVDLAGCPIGAANGVTTFCLEDGGLQTFPALDGGPGGVKMVVTISSSPAAAARARELVAHELGHVLGIGTHSPNADDLMWGSTLSTAVPGPRDAATVRVLYHTRADVLP